MDEFSLAGLLPFLGNRVRSLRQESNITQEKAAERLGITTKHISELERGLTAPSLDLLCRISTLYGVSPSELLQVEQELEKKILIQKLNVLMGHADIDTLQIMLRICLISMK